MRPAIVLQNILDYYIVFLWQGVAPGLVRWPDQPHSFSAIISSVRGFMISFNSENQFDISVRNLKNYKLPEFEKVIDRRGFLYIILDRAYPEWCKIGRTNNLISRLTDYNKNRPIKTAYYSVVSEAFMDVVSVEAVVLEQLYVELQPSARACEWFAIEHYDLLIFWIKRAEKEAPLL